MSPIQAPPRPEIAPRPPPKRKNHPLVAILLIFPLMILVGLVAGVGALKTT